MADLKLSELTDAGVALDGTALVYVVAGGASYQTTVADLLALATPAVALGYTASPTGGTVTNDAGADAVLTLADGTNAGLMAPAQHTKLAGIATGATANSGDATLLARANHTGTQAASTISDFSEAVDDRVAALLVAGAGIGLTYNDASNTLTISRTVAAPVAVSYGASTTIDVTGQSDSRLHRMTLTGNLALDFTGAADGQKVLVELTQDGTGSRTVTLGTSVSYGTDITSFTATTTAGATDVLGFIYNSAAGKYRLVAVAKGY